MADLLTKPRQLAPTVGQGCLESIRADFSSLSTAIAFICNTGGNFITAKAG
jgi:hypothetical protein